MEQAKMLYFAYGSNLNLDQMSRRCPNADPVGGFVLQDWKLVFRGVADIVPEAGQSVHGGLWRITPECEAYLDRYEGYREDGNGMYEKKHLMIDGLPDGETTVMFYVMNSIGIYPPSSGYFAGIKDGYRDFDLPVQPLIAALEASYDDKKPTHVERQRLRRTGRPRLAARPSVVAAEHKSPKQRKAERKAERRKLTKAERAAIKRANARHFHDPWADTSWGSKKTAGKRVEQRQKSLDQWLADKYFRGERF